MQKRFQSLLKVVEKSRQKKNILSDFIIDDIISEEHFSHQKGPIRRDSDQIWSYLGPDTPKPP